MKLGELLQNNEWQICFEIIWIGMCPSIHPPTHPCIHTHCCRLLLIFRKLWNIKLIFNMMLWSKRFAYGHQWRILVRLFLFHLFPVLLFLDFSTSNLFSFNTFLFKYCQSIFYFYHSHLYSGASGLQQGIHGIPSIPNLSLLFF